MYIHFVTYITNDIGFYHFQALNDLKILQTEPLIFFKEWLLNWGSLQNATELTTHKSYLFWKDIGVQLHTKYMILANIFSFGSPYVNVIFYNIIFFIGQLYLYKTFYLQQPQKKWTLLFVIFLVPSVLFWCSGIHKDGWVLAALGLIVYSMNQLLQKIKIKYVVGFIFGCLLLFVVRYFYMITLAPLLILWWFTNKRKNKLVYYLGVFLLTLIVFFNIQKAIPEINPMKMVQNRQAEFLGNIGYSDLSTPKIENNFRSYISNLPTAIDHVFSQPKLSFQNQKKYNASAFDNYLILFIIFISVFFFKKKEANSSMYISLLFYALSMYLFIGYTIPNCGALVRYKSEFTVVLLATLVSMSEWNLFKFKKKSTSL